MSAALAQPRQPEPSLAGEPVIEVRDLVSAFGERVVHEHLSLTVNRGEVFGVVGGSGAGKSVLLNTIIGLKAPEGEIGRASCRERV